MRGLVFMVLVVIIFSTDVMSQEDEYGYCDQFPMTFQYYDPGVGETRWFGLSLSEQETDGILVKYSDSEWFIYARASEPVGDLPVSIDRNEICLYEWGIEIVGGVFFGYGSTVSETAWAIARAYGRNWILPTDFEWARNAQSHWLAEREEKPFGFFPYHVRFEPFFD